MEKTKEQVEMETAAGLPTKEERARELWKIASDEKADPKIRLKAHRLYAELMGYIE